MRILAITLDDSLLALREAASRFVADKYGIYRPEDEILVTIGAMKLSATLTAILEPGDVVFFRHQLIRVMNRCNLVGAEIIEIDTTADRFVLTPEKLEKGHSRAG